LLSFYTSLSEIRTIRTRSVYNIVDMIAEVSGLADVLIVFSKLILSLLFTKNLLTKVLVEYIGEVQTDDKLLDPSEPLSTNPSLIHKAKESINRRVRLKLKLWQALIAVYLPRSLRSDETNRLLDLAS
jgi:hypothetical protein